MRIGIKDVFTDWLSDIRFVAVSVYFGIILPIIDLYTSSSAILQSNAVELNWIVAFFVEENLLIEGYLFFILVHFLGIIIYSHLMLSVKEDMRSWAQLSFLLRFITAAKTFMILFYLFNTTIYGIIMFIILYKTLGYMFQDPTYYSIESFKIQLLNAKLSFLTFMRLWRKRLSDTWLNTRTYILGPIREFKMPHLYPKRKINLGRIFLDLFLIVALLALMNYSIYYIAYHLGYYDIPEWKRALGLVTPTQGTIFLASFALVIFGTGGLIYLLYNIVDNISPKEKL
ncbi:MAG: hypothetical protein J7L47_02415 [Candidatus Odinarchaeota archaeon]|nr:hypothetical protein [Candidatus Odinarchaeota archaeon]